MSHRPNRSILALTALLALAACAPTPPPARMPPPDAIPEPLPPSSTWTPALEEPAPPSRLVRVSDRAVEGDTYAALGLTGREKPNGLAYRLRQDVPAATPAYVPRTHDGLELWIAQPAEEGGWMAFHRGPLGGAPNHANVGYHAARVRPDGTTAWSVDLGRALSRDAHLEIQDVRYRNGALFFNEACQSYAREAEGPCSSLVRMDAASGRVTWRTPPLVSNNVFLLHGPYVVAGYGFTAEPDTLFLLDASTGAVLDQVPLDTAHAYLEFVGDALHVVTRGRHQVYRIEAR